VQMDLRRSTVPILFLLSLLPCIVYPSNAAQTTRQDETAPVTKGSESVTIVGTVVAMTREAWQGADWSVQIVIMRVDSVLDGKKTGRYIRGDFLNHSVYGNSGESRAYDKLVSTFHDKGAWRVQLHPPRGIPECWRVPLPPIPGDLITYGNPDIRPVGGATGYPDVNAVPCYTFTVSDVETIRETEADKKIPTGQ
jgi:hypothetical protein